ncbi:MAG TPA: alpha/beta hydrolase [Fimbriimonadaceae bacterium]|jgi:sigma-B regulation protein RsbQ
MNHADILKRNNVRVTGQGSQVMLFAHGFGCDQNMWRFITPAFEAEYKVVVFDYVGAGKSDLIAYDATKYATLAGYAQDLIEVCDALSEKNIIFVGHSVSSMIGILAARERPDLFERLILVGPSPCYINKEGYTGGFESEDIEGLLQMMDKNYIGWASFLAPVVMGNPSNTVLTEELQESFCSTDPVLARRFARATFLSDNRADLEGFDKPCLILQCAEDMIAPTAVGEFVHQRLPASQLVFMKATGHCPHMSHPEETIELISSYLRSSA